MSKLHTQITVDGETYQRACEVVDPGTLLNLNSDTVDAKCVITWLAGLDEMDRTAVVNAAGMVAESFYA